MTNNQLTREWLQGRIANMECYGVVGDEALILQVYRIALAAMDSEPVAWVVGGDEIDDFNRGREVMVMRDCDDEDLENLPLYRHAQPAPERDQVRNEHAEWSQETFGNVGPVGPLKHLSKEALEAAAEPGDLSEWADMQFLLWDAQRRAGITDEQITQAMIEKLAVNKQREWPEPKDGEPRLHIKAQPAPVVPEGYVMVPKEPTAEMQSAGASAIRIETTAINKLWTGNAVFRAMLVAAPHEVQDE